MSQKKVDQYKASKVNRKKEIEKARKKARVTKIAAIAICVVVLLFVCGSVIKDFVIPNLSSSTVTSELDEKYADLDDALIVSTDTDAAETE